MVSTMGAVVVLGMCGVSSRAQVPADPTNYSRTSTFAYYGTAQGTKAGLLFAEVVEGPAGSAANPGLCVSTQYTYDAYGNKSGATTSNCTGAAGKALFTSRGSISTYAAITNQSITVNGVATTVAAPAGIYATSATNALSQSESREYDPRFGVVTKLTGPNGPTLATSWILDDFGRKTTEIRADGTRTVTRYCYLSGFGRDLSSNSAGCPTPASGEAPADAAMFIHSEPQDSAGNKIGAYVRVYSDRLGRQIRSVTESFDGAAQTVGYSSELIVKDSIYGAYGPKVIESQPYFLSKTSSRTSGTGDVGASKTDYDVLGRPIAIYAADAAASASAPTISFGPYGSRLASTQTILYQGLKTTITNDKSQVHVEEKDVVGQVVLVTDASGAQLARQFDAFGNLISTRDALQNTVRLSYDIRGNKVSMTDPDAGVWGYCYDALGQLKAQQNSTMRGSNTLAACPDNADVGGTATATTGWTTMAYDQLGRLAQRVDPEYTSTWNYETNADGSYCMAGTATTRGAGKLCQVRNSNGSGRKLAYDSLGRSLSSRTDTLNIDGSAGPSFASAVAYDATTGRVVSQTYPTGLQVGYTYTARGILDKLTLLSAATVTPLPATPGGTPGAGTTLPAYNPANGTGTVLWQAQAVNAWGKAERQSYGNGVITRTNVEADNGRTLGLTAGLGSATNVLDHTYAWDTLDNLTGRGDANGDGTGSGAVTEVFAYGDSLNRLTQYTVSGPAMAGLTRSVSMQYNALGMLLYKSDVGNYSYGAQGATSVRPHALQSVSGGVTNVYTYDANGNLQTASTGKYQSITYTSFNLPDSQLGGIAGRNNTPRYQWRYDENHARLLEVRTIVGGAAAGTRTTWNLHPDNQGGLGFEREINLPTTGSAANPTAQTNRHYLTAGGQVIGALLSGGPLPTLGATQTAPTPLASITLVKVEYWHKDHLGSLAATTDHAGSVTARYAYDPFGKRRDLKGNYDAAGTVIADWSPAINSGTDRGFTGHDHLDDVGLIHMNGRIFDPTMAVFLQGDPHIQNPLDLQNYNRYGYCLNNPLTCTDPSGLNWIKDLSWFDPLGYKIKSSIAKNKYGYEIGSYAISVASLYCYAWAAVCNAAGQAAWSGYAGASLGESAKVGALSYISAKANTLIGTYAQDYGWNTAAHAAWGCAEGKLSGGGCGAGARGALAHSALQWADVSYGDGGVNNIDDRIINTMIQAGAGGLAAYAGGGSFSQGARSAAYAYLYNQLGSSSRNSSNEPIPVTEQERIMSRNSTFALDAGDIGGAELFRIGFWEDRYLRGDPLAEIGIGVVLNDTFKGWVTNVLAGTTGARGTRVGVDIISTYVRYLDQDFANTNIRNWRGVLSDNQITAFHREVFVRQGIPMSRYVPGWMPGWLPGGTACSPKCDSFSP